MSSRRRPKASTYAWLTEKHTQFPIGEQRTGALRHQTVTQCPSQQSPVVLFIHQSQQQLVCFVRPVGGRRALGFLIFIPVHRAPRAAPGGSAALVVAGENPRNLAPPRKNPRESRRESTRIPGRNPAIRVATARNPENPRPKSTSEMLASFTVPDHGRDRKTTRTA